MQHPAQSAEIVWDIEKVDPPVAGSEIADLIGRRIPLPDQVAGVCRGNAEALVRNGGLPLRLLARDPERDFAGQRRQSFECMFGEWSSREYGDYADHSPVQHQRIPGKGDYSHAPGPFLVYQGVVNHRIG